MQPQASPPLDLTTTGPGSDDFWPLSGKPYHSFILAKTHVAPSCYLTLPSKLHSLLPSTVMPVVLNYGAKKWTLNYYGNRRSKAFDTRIWRQFVNENCLKAGDGCVFELTECSASIIKIKVQILRSDIPFQLHDKFSGESKDVPIFID